MPPTARKSNNPNLTRSEALKAGLLIELPDAIKTKQFTIPVTISKDAWKMAVYWPEGNIYSSQRFRSLIVVKAATECLSSDPTVRLVPLRLRAFDPNLARENARNLTLVIVDLVIDIEMVAPDSNQATIRLLKEYRT